VPDLSAKFQAGRSNGDRGATAVGHGRGATAVEYGVLVAFVALVVIAAVSAFGFHLDDVFTNIVNRVK
jgi:pilus assembly protein Flp/PilA